MSETPARVAKYLRISLDKTGDEHGVANQDADTDRCAEARGLTIVRTFTDNDISASNGSKRPDYIAMMAAAERREFDAILVWQSSRLWRSRRERAEAIEILRKAGVSVIAARGPSLDMSTAYGRGMAALLGEFDTMEVEVKGERQQLAEQRAAEQGIARKGCPRPFGWLDDRVTMHPEEGPAVAEAARALLAGCTISGIARAWDKAGLRPPRTPYGPPRRWTRTSVTAILTSPRVAGISSYGGKGGDGKRKETGRGEWQPLIREDTYRAVVKLLGDPSRSKQQGVRTMLGGLAQCWCGNTVSAGQNHLGQPIYRCNPATRTGQAPSGSHVKARSEPVNRYIGEMVIELLSGPDAAEALFRRNDDPARTAALRDEAQAIRARLKALGADFAAGLVDRDDVRSGRKWGEARLAAINAELAELGRESALAPMMAAGNARAAWEELRADQRRVVVGALMKVVLHPAGRGVKVFDPKSVEIVPRMPARPESTREA